MPENALKEKIENRVKALKEARQKLVDDANKQVSMFDVAISELELALNPEEPKEEKQEEI